MSIKNPTAVRQYESDVAAAQAAIENLQEFLVSMPAPEDDQLPTLHYGHAGLVQEIRFKLAEVVALADRWGAL